MYVQLLRDADLANDVLSGRDAVLARKSSSAGKSEFNDSKFGCARSHARPAKKGSGYSDVVLAVRHLNWLAC